MPIRCEVGGETVECALLGVTLHKFGRDLGAFETVPYSVELSAVEVIAKFDNYYRLFKEIESEADNETTAQPEGDYLLLKNTGYLDLAQMLVEQPNLLSRLILKQLPAEFMGYMFGDNNDFSFRFVINTLSYVDITDGVVSCKGFAYIYPYRSILGDS